MNRDVLTNMPVVAAARGSMAIIDRLQQMKPHEQAASMAATFVLLCEHLRIAPADVFAIVTNIMNHAEGRRPEFAAVAQYMQEEL